MIFLEHAHHVKAGVPMFCIQASLHFHTFVESDVCANVAHTDEVAVVMF
jgi:hypothetical protein